MAPSNRIILLACLLGSTASTAWAQAERDFNVTLTPYAWLAWPRGDVEVRSGDNSGGGGGGLNFPPIDANFDDVKLSGIFTGSADIRYKRFGLYGDLSYFSVKADKHITISDDSFISGNVKVSGTKAMLFGYWRAYDNGPTQVDLMAGVHYLKPEVKVNITTARGSVNPKVDNTMVDPIIGVRGSTDFTKHFGINGFATYGGFGADSDDLYDLYGAAHWRFSRSFTASLGYRYFSDKFSGRRLDYDTSFSGPLLGLEFSF